MPKASPKPEPILHAIAKSPERSSLFWWLYDHHDEILSAAGGKRIQWVPHVTRFAELGLRDGEGKPVTARTASDTWAEVKRDVAERQAVKAAVQVRNKHPSRLPATWRPQEATPPPRQAVRESGPVFGPPANETREERAARILAGIRESIKARSG